MPPAAPSTPLKLGFIGGSLNSAVGYAHFVSSTMDNQWTIEAGCFSANPQRNKEAAQTYSVASDRVYDNWREMISEEKGRLDAIVTLTPTPLHFEVVTACLQQGVSVICEKSLTTTTAEAEEILELRNQRNLFIAMIYNYSGYPMVRELHDLIRKGALGRILHFQAEMAQEGYIRVDSKGNRPAPQRWRLADGRVPIIYLDLAVHLHQLIHYLIRQRPIEVISDQKSYGWFPEVVDNVTCLCRYSEGVQGQMWFSKSALGHRNGLRLRIYGSDASAEWYQASPEELVLAFADGRREIRDRASSVEVANLRRYNRFKAGHPAGFIEALANLYTDIADCHRQYKATGKWKSDDVFSVELAMEGHQLFDAMIESIDQKTWQAVSSQVRIPASSGDRL
jgi:predicted dehydrogenase